MSTQVDDIEEVGRGQHRKPYEVESIERNETLDTRATASSPPYSIFTLYQRRLVLFIAAFTATFSPLSSFIYYPALDSLAADLHTTGSRINLTITSYMIVSGIVPTMWGDLAAQVGRRPVFMAMFSIYIAANVGLALQRSYPALLVLRMMQSLGGSATVGLSYGIIGDIITPVERGQGISIAACGPNVTPALGPVFGGILAEKAGWPYIFWFIIILAGVALAFIILLYRETSRKIVGNGSISARVVNKRLIDLCPPLSSPSSADPLVVLSQRKCLRFPNPFLRITLFLSPHNTPIMLIYGLFYTDYCVLQASLSTLFVNNYHYSTLVAGLTYIPFGAGCFLAALFGGRILNRDYCITAAKHGLQKVDKVVGDDLLKFPIVEARLRSVPVTITLTAACMIPFGFLLEHKLHPKRPATAQASVNLVRCAMAGGGLAALQPLINAVGPGWCFVIFARLTLSGLGFWWIEMRWGLEWWRKSTDAKYETDDRTK